jgi:predicted amidohydrolase
MHLPLRIAVAQPHMHWSIDDHVDDARRAIAQASSLDAQMIVFPELTLTGLHTKVPALLDPSTIAEAIRSLAAISRDHEIWAAIGAPVFADASRPYDACVLISPSGDVALTSPKMRLMPPGEPMIFEPGTARPILDVEGTSIGVVICREMLDHDDLLSELNGRARIILWPGVMARAPYNPADPEDYAACAVRVATGQDVWIIHSNWATNIQVPGLPNTGKSLVIAPSGEIVLEAPAQTAGILLSWKDSLAEAWLPA